MKSIRQFLAGTVAGLAVFFLLWLGLSWNLIVAGILAIGTYAGVFLITKPALKIGEIRVDTLPDGNELKELLLEARKDMEEIEKASKQISNQEMRFECQKLYNTGVGIMKYLEKNPDSIKSARRFLTYYLDTAAQILNKYLPFQNSGLETDEVRRVRNSTEKALPILNKAFEEQFTKLMQNDIFDIESDIKLLEMTLESEGGIKINE